MAERMRRIHVVHVQKVIAQCNAAPTEGTLLCGNIEQRTVRTSVVKQWIHLIWKRLLPWTRDSSVVGGLRAPFRHATLACAAAAQCSTGLFADQEAATAYSR